MLALGRLGLVLERAGQPREALPTLQRCHARGVDIGAWNLAYDVWFRERSRHIDELLWWKRPNPFGKG